MNNEIKYAPICLFTYNRLSETKETITSLKANSLAVDSDLFIFSDGSKNNLDKDKVNEVRDYLRTISGFKSVNISESKVNRGLAESIVSGVTSIVEIYEKVIVLEDDIVTSRGFLSYMNSALTYYESFNNVMQISSFMFPIDSHNLPDTFFYPANTCWGWGTWKSSWSHYNDDSSYLIDMLKSNNISWREFNSLQGREFEKQLLRNLSGSLRSWAVKWHAAIIINKGTVLHPKVSYVSNIGFSGNGENCNKGSIMGKINNELSLDVVSANIESNDLAMFRLKQYFIVYYSFYEKLKRRIKSFF